MSKYKFFIRLLKAVTLAFILVSSTPLYGQVDSTLRRHFIISIDKYPLGYGNFIYSQEAIDAAKHVLNKEFNINKNDYVSILYYGISTGASSSEAFITTPYYGGAPLIGLDGKSYYGRWEQYNRNHSYYSESGLHYSMQKAAYPYSFYVAANGITNKVNRTYLLRITDNVENNWKGAVSEYGAFLGSSSISETQWMSVIDSVELSYSFDEEIRIDNSRYYSISGKYGIYVCQVVPKDKPTIKGVVDVGNIDVRQVKDGHKISFDYSETSGYSLERFYVEYKYATNSQYRVAYDTIGISSGHVEFLIPEELHADAISLRSNVWGASKTACGAMIISPYDSITGYQLEDVKTLNLERAQILGMPLTRNWPWFTDDAQLTALIWTIIFVILAVVFLYTIYFILRKYRITSQNTSISVKSQSPITIDLMDKNKRSVVAAKLKIDIQKPSIWAKGRLVKQAVTAEIIIDKSKAPNFIISDDALYLSHNNFTIRDYSTDIEVYARTNAFNDYKEAQTEENSSKRYALPVTVSLKSDNGNELASKSVLIDVFFEKIQQTPMISLSNKKGEDVKVFEVTYVSSGIKDVIGSSQFHETNNLQRRAQIENPQAALSCETCDALSIVDNKLVVDYSLLQNPTEEYVDYPYFIKYTYKESGYNSACVIKKEFILRVLRNNTAPQLRVWIKDRRSSEKIELENKKDVESRNEQFKEVCLSDIHFIPVIPEDQDQRLREFRKNDVFIENAATEGATGASIKITNLKLTPIVIQKDAKQYESDIESFIDFENPEEPVMLYNGSSSVINPKVGWSAFNRKIDYSDAKRGRKFDITVRIKIEFKYSIDSRGNGFFDGEKEYETSFIYKIYQDARPEWLGIDFGTSAIVAFYSDTEGIRDLHKVKDELYKDEAYKNDSYESGTVFLSSNVIFKNSEGINVRHYPTPTDGEKPYHSAAICLSPTSSLEQAFNGGILPCLKLMVGYEYLPMLSALQGQEYCYNEETITFGEDMDNPLSKVENIFREVYNQLLRFFVLPKLQGKPNENIVLTVPNTYTSSHLIILEDCIKKSSIGKDVRNIRFVSESDAVACYYQSNWALLNKGRAPIEDETVLVYDMGAGTLDISLLHRQVNGGQTTITVLGKIGVGRAGNYLDTLLAEVLSKMQPQSELTKYLPPAKLDKPEDFKIASAWKHIIKNKIKPLMNTSTGSHTLSKAECDDLKIDHGFSVNISALKSSKEYENYVQACSTEILKEFFEFQGLDKHNNRPKIDTLVLSGRASNQTALIQSLQSVLNEWCGTDSFIIPLWKERSDSSKTSVIEGAINLLTRFTRRNSHVEFVSSNITADYGIIFKDDCGKTCYKELLSHNDTPDDTVYINGLKHSVYHKEHYDVDLHSVTEITLIQTYTKDPVLSEGDGTLSEFCTVIGRYLMPSDVDDEHLKIVIDIDEQGRIDIDIDGAGDIPQAATQVDLNSEVYQKGLWPMMSKVETNN